MCSFALFSGLATSRLGCTSRVTLHFTGLEISWQVGSNYQEIPKLPQELPQDLLELTL